MSLQRLMDHSKIETTLVYAEQLSSSDRPPAWLSRQGGIAPLEASG